MRKAILLIIVFLTHIHSNILAQSVSIDASIDSLQILIGEQAKIKLQVSVDTEKKVFFPIFRDTLMQGIEILETSKLDTLLLNGGKRAQFTQEYTITSFDSALYYIHPLKVMVDSTIYFSDPLALKVHTVPVPIDPENPEDFFGNKPNMNLPFLWKDWYATIICVILLIPFIFLFIYLLKSIKENKPIIRRVKVEPQLPPHQIAIQEIERIKKEKVWKEGLHKEYYTNLTDAIRSYIKGRFDFNALEMTSTEIIEKLLESQDKKSISDLCKLFETADLVKFAKYTPQINEHDTNLITAIDFINNTQIINDEKKSEPSEIVVIEKRSLRAKILLSIGIIIITLTIITLLFYICKELYYYFV